MLNVLGKHTFTFFAFYVLFCFPLNQTSQQRHLAFEVAILSSNEKNLTHTNIFFPVVITFLYCYDENTKMILGNTRNGNGNQKPSKTKIWTLKIPKMVLYQHTTTTSLYTFPVTSLCYCFITL